MNFDYLEASKSLDKDNICLDYLKYEAAYSSGWNKFIYEGCKAVEIWLNPETNSMKLKGSIPYFMTGHNFKTTHKDFINGLNHLSEVLNLDLLKAEVNVFEYGTILEIPFPAREIFNSHLKIQGMKTRSFDYGKYFENGIMTFKLYDVNRNLKNKLTKDEREKLTSLYDYKPSANYLKIESHYKKPSIYFKSRLLDLDYLTSEAFQTICKEELQNKYRSIMKSNSIEITSKKQLNSSTIPLMILKEYENLLPAKAEELIKQKIKSIPSDVMTKEDKKSRRRQIKANMKKLESFRTCQYDISNLLEEKIIKN